MQYNTLNFMSSLTNFHMFLYGETKKLAFETSYFPKNPRKGENKAIKFIKREIFMESFYYSNFHAPAAK